MANRDRQNQSLGTVSYKVMELGPHEERASAFQAWEKCGDRDGQKPCWLGLWLPLWSQQCRGGIDAKTTCTFKEDLPAGVNRTVSSPAP